MTQNEMILDYLNKKGSITTYESFTELFITRLSARIHDLKQMGYEVEYESISTSMDGFDSAIRHLLGDFDGFNITIPYKRDVFAYLDGIEGDALLCGAVNTVINKTRIGYIHIKLIYLGNKVISLSKKEFC